MLKTILPIFLCFVLSCNEPTTFRSVYDNATGQKDDDDDDNNSQSACKDELETVNETLSALETQMQSVMKRHTHLTNNYSILEEQNKILRQRVCDLSNGFDCP